MGSAARLHRDNTWRSLQPTTLHGRVRSIGAEIPLRSTDTRVLPSLARVLTSSALASGMIICVAPNALVSASGILTAALSCEHHEHDKRHGDNYGDVERRQGHRRHGWPKRKGARAQEGSKGAAQVCTRRRCPAAVLRSRPGAETYAAGRVHRPCRSTPKICGITPTRRQRARACGRLRRK